MQGAHVSSLKRIAACASALALATGTTLAGAGAASAQDDGTGSLDIGSIDIVSIGASLQTASDALNGPVTVVPNDEGGPTVTYTNETGEAETCFGFTMPYSAVDEVGLDSSGDGPSSELLPQILEIQAMGGVSIMTEGPDGELTSFDATMENGVAQHALYLAIGQGVQLDDGESVTWTATAPEEPAAAVALCLADSNEAEGLDALDALESHIGIDPQIVADQMNDIFPGGSLDAGSVNGGSVELGADLLTPFATASSVLGGDD